MNDISAQPSFATTNPATLAAGKSYPGHGGQQAARQARPRRRSPAPTGARPASRSAPGSWRAAAGVLRQRRDEFAALMTEEMGKTVTDGRAEVDKCASACEHFAEQAAATSRAERVAIEAAQAFVTFNPLGVVLAVMPWNFPFWQVFRFAAPALMAGNGGVLKHASNVPGCALAIESVFSDAGFPDGLFATALIDERRRSRRSSRTRTSPPSRSPAASPPGRSVAAVAAAALKKCVLELGGSDAYLVLEDADVAAAARSAPRRAWSMPARAALPASASSSCDGSREAFEQALVVAMRAYAIGDPRDPAHRARAAAERRRARPGPRPGQRASRRARAAARRRDARPARRLVPGDRARQASAPASRRTTRRYSAR